MPEVFSFQTNYFIILDYIIVNWKLMFFLERIIVSLKITFSNNLYHIETSQLWYKFSKKLQTCWSFPEFLCFQLPNVDEKGILCIPKILLKNALNKLMCEKRDIDKKMKILKTQIKWTLNNTDWYLITTQYFTTQRNKTRQANFKNARQKVEEVKYTSSFHFKRNDQKSFLKTIICSWAKFIICRTSISRFTLTTSKNGSFCFSWKDTLVYVRSP